VPNAGDTWFADLTRIGAIRKSYAARCGHRRGVTSDEESSRFARLVGRKSSRFPFPNDVTYWFKPLEDVAASKHDKLLSAEGRVFNLVEELRVGSAKSWSEAPHELTLLVVLKRDVLPVFQDNEYPDITSKIEGKIRPQGKLRPTDQLATMLEESHDPVERYWLWQALAEAWAAKCQPKQSDLKYLDPQTQARVVSAIADGEIAFELTTVDELSMYDYIRTEMLDLDYLSPPESMFRLSSNTQQVDGPPSASDRATLSIRLRQWLRIRLKRMFSRR